jgi:peptidoglycan hydrolase-like protein with peptidoglycan-binding domain
VSLAVQQLQRRLLAAGFNPGPIDGLMGPRTRAAQRAFQSANPNATDSFQPPAGRRFASRGTGYYPDASPLEGGFQDRLGRPLHTLQDYLAGRAPYVSVAMDSRAFPYGTKLRIPELEAKYGRPIEFRVVDTGGAFRGRGTTRIDICTANRRASLDATINGPLTLVVA